jgi:cyclopropane fatty-acyl-phospholipid synthase-like methyltransferase
MDRFTPGLNVVDVGSGLGGPARMLTNKYNAHVTGVEYIRENVSVA